MLLKNISKSALLFSLLICAGMYHYGSTAATMLQDKASAQEEQLTEFAKWKSKYNKLVHIEKAWTQQIPPMTEARDLFSIYSMINTGPAVNPDTLVVDTVNALKIKDTAVKGQRVCLSSLGGTGVVFTGATLPSLYDQFTTLSQKPGITFDSITVSFEQPSITNKSSMAKLTASGFCITLRD
jgi:hypothetical protein